MKKIFLMFIVALGLLIPSAAFVGHAAAKPGTDINSSCGQGSKNCNNAGLTQSNGCNASSQDHNPHCVQPPAAPVTAAAPGTPIAVQNNPSGGNKGNNAKGNAAAGSQLPFTGVNAAALALLGALLLGAGLTLRRRAVGTETRVSL